MNFLDARLDIVNAFSYLGRDFLPPLFSDPGARNIESLRSAQAVRMLLEQVQQSMGLLVIAGQGNRYV